MDKLIQIKIHNKTTHTPAITPCYRYSCLYFLFDQPFIKLLRVPITEHLSITAAGKFAGQMPFLCPSIAGGDRGSFCRSCSAIGRLLHNRPIAALTIDRPIAQHDRSIVHNFNTDVHSRHIHNHFVYDNTLIHYIITIILYSTSVNLMNKRNSLLQELVTPQC